ncbi:MAG TPA: hypothetical protein PLP17_15850, partial [Oligoflexia bacterium]|nr:hypothetical protein [Oligoflexia bacterium]
MQRICAVTGGPFETSAAEVEYCRANDVPLPVLSFPERLRQMLVFRNRPYLYHSTCAYSGKPILSCVPPERGLSVYDVELWQSDVWDARNYAQNYNFQQPFFQQFGRLFSRVPYPNLAVVLPTMENSFYTNGITSAKNCYLVFSSSFTEDCMFSYALWHSRCLVDCVFAKQCELCFDCVNITDCYNLRFSEHCQNCTDSAFLFQCYGCANCWLCTNLSHRSYCFENEQLSKTQYEKKIQEIDLGSRIAVNAQKRRFRKISAAAPIKVYYGAENLNSSGNHIRNTRNCRNCFFVTNSEDLTDCIYLDRAKSSIAHAHFGTDTELIYNSVTAGDSVYNLRFCAECWQGSRDLEYCILCCYGCSHCFGCTGLRKASYCILNRQYTKDEYFALL